MQKYFSGLGNLCSSGFTVKGGLH